MPDNRLEQDGLYGRINSLEEEIADLKYTNQKLYKDCVTFAKKLKKIQVSGILDEDVDGLKELNTQYAEEIAALKEQIVALTIENQNMREVSQANELKETLEDIEDELPIVLEPAAGPEEEELFADEIAAPSLETIQNTELANATRTGNTVSFKALKLDEPDDEPEVGPAMRNSNQGRTKRAPAPQQPRTSHRKGSPGRRILRGILATLLTLVLLLALISGIVGLFAHNFPDATIGGLRCYTVQNDAMAPNVKQTDVIVVKKVAMEKLQPSNVILSTYGDRSFGSVEAIETRDGANYIVAADNTGATYDVTADQYLGKAVYRIAGLGKLTKYALTHRINYFAVLASLALVLIALLILFPSRKPRRKDQPKFGRDYNVEDFTI
jgi:Predicted membrane protein